MGEQHRGVDFFVSYTAADQAWAEWIPWALLLVVRPCRARLCGIHIEQLRSVRETDLMHARDRSAVLGGV